MTNAANADDPGQAPYRVAVWGIGTLGGALVRQIERSAALELTAAFSYSTDKIGKDVGDVLGLPTIGVRVIGDRDDFIAERPDVVLFAPFDIGVEDDILALLGAGLNVITPLAYRGLRFQEDGGLETFQRRAEEGGATFYVTGVNPDFVTERLVLTLTGVCNEITHIYQKEIFKSDDGQMVFDVCGWGKPLDEVQSDAFTVQLLMEMAQRYFEPSIKIAAEHLGHDLDRVTTTYMPEAAPHDVETPFGTVRKGTLGSFTFRWEGFINDEPFFTVDGSYYCGTLRPSWATGDDSWEIEIEGRPSLRVVVESWASVKEETKRYEDDPTSVGYYVTGAPIIQAIPHVVNAPAGVLETEPPAIHYKRDLRL